MALDDNPLRDRQRLKSEIRHEVVNEAGEYLDSVQRHIGFDAAKASRLIGRSVAVAVATIVLATIVSVFVTYRMAARSSAQMAEVQKIADQYRQNLGADMDATSRSLEGMSRTARSQHEQVLKELRDIEAAIAAVARGGQTLGRPSRSVADLDSVLRELSPEELKVVRRYVDRLIVERRSSRP